MAVDYVKHKHEIDNLHNKIERLQNELNVENDNVLYYKELLMKTREQMLVIKNLVDAKTKVPDSETANEAWTRNIKAVINKLRGIDK